MPRVHLNQRYLDRLKAPDPSGKQKMFWDRSLPGFGVRVSGSTNQMSFIAQRTLPNGRDRRVTIAAVGELTLEAARVEARNAIHGMRQGIDPKHVRKGIATLEEALEAYLLARPNLSAKSVKDYRGSITKYLKEWLTLKLGDITADMVQKRHVEMKDHRALANSVMRALRAIYYHAIESRPELKNPVKLRKQWYDVPRRERLVRADDLKKFYDAVAKLPNPVARDYLLLILFTGLRRSEAASLTWADVDFAARIIRVKASATKARRKLDLPMSSFVLALLEARRKIGDTHWIFPADSDSGRISEPKYPLELVKAETGIEISVHDLRRTFITAAENTNMSAYALKALVNHVLHDNGDATAGYIRMTTDRLREPAQQVSISLWNGAGSNRFLKLWSTAQKYFITKSSRRDLSSFFLSFGRRGCSLAFGGSRMIQQTQANSSSQEEAPRPAPGLHAHRQARRAPAP